MRAHLPRHVRIAIFILMAAGGAAGGPAGQSDAVPPTIRITGRMSADQFRSILAQAQAEQTDSGLSPELKQDASALAAAVQTFQKNYSGLGGFLRNVQIRQPAVSHQIADIKKRHGKEMIPREPSDVSEMATAAERCINYLNSPDLESGVTYDVARVIRQTADSNLQKMDEQAERISGIALGSLIARANQRVADAVRARENRAQIPVVAESIRSVESALDQGNIRAAVQGWNTLTSDPVLFQFERNYIDANTPLLADITLLDSCKSGLQNVQDRQPKLADGQRLLLVHSCRSSAASKPNTTAFLDEAERSIAQAVAQEFGNLPSDNDLKRFLQTGQQAQAVPSQAVAPPGLADSSAPPSQGTEEETATAEQESFNAAEGEAQAAPDNTQDLQQPKTSAFSSTEAPQNQLPVSLQSDSLSWPSWGLWVIPIVGVGIWLVRRRNHRREELAYPGQDQDDLEEAELRELEKEKEPGEWEKLGRAFAEFAGDNDTRWTAYLSDTNEREASNCLVLDLALIAGTFCHEEFDEAMLSLSFSSITGELPGFEHRMAFLKQGQYTEIVGEVWTPHSMRAAARCDAATGSQIAPALANLFKQWVSAVVSKVSSSTQEKCAAQVESYNNALDSLSKPATAEAGHEKLAEGGEQNMPTKFEEDCQLLGLGTDFTLEELGAARRRKAAQWHPDKLTGMAPELSEYAGREMVKINLASDRLEKVVKAVSAETLPKATETMTQMVRKYKQVMERSLPIVRERGDEALGLVEEVVDLGDEVIRMGFALRARFRRETPTADVSMLEETVQSLMNSNKSLRSTLIARQKAKAAGA